LFPLTAKLFGVWQAFIQNLSTVFQGAVMGDKQRKISRNNTGSLAKAGMLAAMGTAVYSGFAGGKLARFIHPWAGLALVGFAIWHQQINMKRKRTV